MALQERQGRTVKLYACICLDVAAAGATEGKGHVCMCLAIWRRVPEPEPEAGIAVTSSRRIGKSSGNSTQRLVAVAKAAQHRARRALVEQLRPQQQ